MSDTKDEGWIESGQSASWGESEVLIGKYVRMKTNVGMHGSNVYIVHGEDGSELSVWGSTVINGRFEEIPIGSMVKIEPLGETKSKQGTKYKDYRIMYIPPKEKIEDPFEQQEMPEGFLKD